MMHSYLTFADETVVIFSDIKNGESVPTVEVNFERPINEGFASARCELPTYRWINNDGFNANDIAFFEEFLRHNAHTLFEFAERGGMSVA